MGFAGVSCVMLHLIVLCDAWYEIYVCLGLVLLCDCLLVIVYICLLTVFDVAYGGLFGWLLLSVWVFSRFLGFFWVVGIVVMVVWCSRLRCACLIVVVLWCCLMWGF